MDVFARHLDYLVYNREIGIPRLHGEQQTSTSGLLCAFDDAEYFNINDLRRYLSRKNITLNGKVSFLAVQYSQK